MLTLNWIGKDAVLNHHKEVPFHLLRCDPKRSVGDESGNLLVQGDNALTITKSITLVQLWMKFLEVKTSLLQLFGKKYLRQKVLLDIYQKTMNSYWFTHKIKIFGHEIYV